MCRCFGRSSVVRNGRGVLAAAAAISQQHGLLSGDAPVVAVMREHGLVNVASHDVDFDRVPAPTRYWPA